MKKRIKSKKKVTEDGGWETVQGWRKVQVGDELLVGAEEYGFMELEEIDPSELGDQGILLQPEAVEDTEKQNVEPVVKKKKRKRSEGGKDASKESKSNDDLLEYIAKLENENEKLKMKTKTKKIQGNKEKKNSSNGDETTGAPLGKNCDTKVDVSMWEDFFLLDGILDQLAKAGFSAPTQIQAECLPAAIRDRRDIIGAAQTGSGKTLAFGLPILNYLHQQKSKEMDDQTIKETRAPKMRCLIMVPTRELCMQVCQHLTQISKAVGIRVVPIVGGISHQKQERLLSKHPPEIVVATPGRLWEMIREGQKHVSDFSSLKFLVLDEADRMVHQGHYEELTSVFQLVRQNCLHTDDVSKMKNADRLQTFVFSATLTLPSSMKKRLRKGGGGSSGGATLEALMDAVPFASEKPKIVDITTSRKLADKVSESYVSCPEKERDTYLYCILASHPGRTLVFVNAISAVRRLAAVLKVLGLPVKALHAGMQQRSRLKALDKFKSDPKAILVATDVAARGLDIKDVACVVHYQIPASADTYVHRSGRTARAEADGISIAFVTPKEHVRFRALLHSLGSDDIPEFPIDASLMKECRERVGLAVKYDSIVRKESKKKAEKSWLQLNAEQMDILLSDNSDNEEIQGRKLGLKKSKTVQSAKSANQERKDAEAIKSQLDRLITEPLQPKFSKKFFTGGAASGVSFQNKGEPENSIAHTVKSVTGLAAEKTQARKNIPTKKTKKPKDRAEALAAAVQKHIDRKRQKKGLGGKLVVAHAFGRNMSGATALQALQNT